MAVALNLLVIRVADLEHSRRFYEALGLLFSRQQHGNGPEHFAADFAGVVFEIYPRGCGLPTSGLRLGFRVASVIDAVASAERLGAGIVSPPAEGPLGLRAVVVDPDGNRIEISQ
jgi:predicted enzyme related to lactoylglutathione lyase